MNETLRRIMDAVLGKAQEDRPQDQPWADHAVTEALLRLERLAQIGRMTAGFAHDVRTPLHIIASAIETASGGLPGRSKALAELRNAQRNCRKMLSMLNDILDFAKGERGPMKEHALSDVAGAALSLVQAACAKHGIAVKRHWGAAPPVKMHLRSLEGVFFNVFNNAVDAMPGGGMLTVKTSSNKRFIWAAVKDTGPGMSPEAIRHVSTPGHTTKESGSGMGLYLSRQVLAEHRAELLFSSEEGKGTTVTIRFLR
ncbi:MAG: HAMP domain-containing histidine kinase [Elusimicrobia bacterium]|nr:HAMP domain-containing histidine kinase [Elusimicrobiota bacterium]